MTKNSTIISSVQSEDLQMADELASLTKIVLRSAGLIPISDDVGTETVSLFSQAVGILRQIDKERPELGLEAGLKDLMRRYLAGEQVNPAATLIELMERAGLRQPPASA